MKRREKNQSRNMLLPLVVIAGVIGVWETFIWIFQLPTYILPAPSQIFLGLISDLSLLWVHAQVTTVEILVGFAMSLAIGVPCAILIVYSKPLESALYPLLVFSQIVPKIAVAPLFLIWFGFGWAPKILLVVLIAIFPIIINTIIGLKSVDPQAILMIRSMNASAVKIFCKVTFPSALPTIFGGLKVAITLAVIGAVVAEWVASERGLGYLLLSAGANFQSILLFEALTVVTLIGALLFFLIDVLERRFVPQRSGESWLQS